MALDTKALVVATILVTMMLSLLDLVIWRTRRTFPGFGRWAVGHAMFGPTLLLYALRDVLPDFVTILVANAASLLTGILVLEAAREFRGLKPRLWQPYAAATGALATMAYFRYVSNNLNARGFVSLITISVIGLLAAKTLLTDIPRDREIGLKYTGWLVTVSSLLMLGRGIYYVFQPVMTELFVWSTPNLIAFIGLSVAVTGISYGVLVMSGELVLSDLKASERRTARANLELNRLRRGLETAVVERTAELRETQRALMQAQKLESLGRLAGGVAHDFGNFLTVISSYTRLLEKELDPASPLRDDLAQMNAACLQAILLTQQLLAFSRRQPIEFRILDLNEIIRGMTKMMGQLLGEGVEVAISPRATEARVRADSGQMHQVILNLFLNARDAMPRGGRLEISTAEVELKQGDALRLPDAEPGRYVELAVRDTGEGMSEETQAHIFEPFFTTKQAGHGTGLGLATVYGIVRQAGGHIDVETAPGKGTTFRIRMPLAMGEVSPEPDPRPALSRQQAPIAASRVLLVDDASAIRKVLRRILEGGGYLVSEAATADAASEILLHEHVDLILTDLQMPGRSGVDLAREARQSFPAVKVIAMSGFHDAQLGDLPKELGIEAALAKPMLPDTLLDAVRDAIGKKGYSKTV